MGYTHYWRRPARLDSEKFSKAVADCKKICKALPIPLGDWRGEGKPKFDKNIISFNGHVNSQSYSRVEGLVWPTNKADDVGIIHENVVKGNWYAGPIVEKRCVGPNGDGSYESFIVPRIYEPADWEKPKKGKYFSFCKTNYRPCDLCVQCCLIVLNEYFGNTFSVSSDGEDENWNEARSVCQHIVQYGLLFELRNS